MTMAMKVQMMVVTKDTRPGATSTAATREMMVMGRLGLLAKLEL